MCPHVGARPCRAGLTGRAIGRMLGQPSDAGWRAGTCRSASGPSGRGSPTPDPGAAARRCPRRCTHPSLNVAGCPNVPGYGCRRPLGAPGWGSSTYVVDLALPERPPSRWPRAWWAGRTSGSSTASLAAPSGVWMRAGRLHPVPGRDRRGWDADGRVRHRAVGDRPAVGRRSDGMRLPRTTRSEISSRSRASRRRASRSPQSSVRPVPTS